MDIMILVDTTSHSSIYQTLILQATAPLGRPTSRSAKHWMDETPGPLEGQDHEIVENR